MVSDGEGNRGKASSEAVERAYLANGIRLFFVNIQKHYFQVEEERLGLLDVEEVALVTGGMFANIEDESGAKLSAATHGIEDRIANYYLVRIGSLNTAEKPRQLWLDLMDANGKRRKDVDLTFPHKVLPCPAKPMPSVNPPPQ